VTAVRAPQLLRDKVARGELGRKSGQGFYLGMPYSSLIKLIVLLAILGGTRS